LPKASRGRAQALEPGPSCGRANKPNRSGAAARAPMPLLWRPHDRHRDFQGRLPAPSPANRASRRSQDRHLMIVNSSRTSAHFPRWSLTSNAAAQPDRCPALHLRRPASPKRSASTAHSKPITQSGAHNQLIPAPHRLLHTRPVPSNRHSAQHCPLSTSRGFLLWRLSDDGPGACRTAAMGRRPKPFTVADYWPTVSEWSDGPKAVGQF